MKTKQNNKKKTSNRLLFFELANFKIYGTTFKKPLNYKNVVSENIFSIKQTSIQFKKILQIIFQYHLNRKKILIIGEKPLLKKQMFYIHKKVKHIFIPKASWVNGLLSNTNKKIKNFKKKKNPLLTLIKRPRLIILYNYWDLIDAESYNRKIVNVILSNPSLEQKYRYNKNPAYFILNRLTSIRKKKMEFFFSTLIEKIIKLPKLKRRFFVRKWKWKIKKKSKNFISKKHQKSKKKKWFNNNQNKKNKTPNFL